MTKYAFILAALLGLTACQSERNSGDRQTGVGDNSTPVPGTSRTTKDSLGSQTTPSTQGRLFDRETVGQTAAGTADQTALTTPAPTDSTSITSQQTDRGVATAGQVAQGTLSTNPVTPPDQAQQVPSSPGQTPGANDTTSTPGQTAQTGATPSSLDQSAQGTSAANQSGTATGTVVSPAATDQALSQGVTNSLMNAGISAQDLMNVHVRSINGRIVLTGRVADDATKQKIEQQIKQIPGVKNVTDLLRVEETGKQATEPSPSATPTPGTTDSNPSTTPGQNPPPGSP